MKKHLGLLIAALAVASLIAFGVVYRLSASPDTWMACFWAWLIVVGTMSLSMRLRQSPNLRLSFAYPAVLRLVLLPFLIALIAWLYRPEIVPFAAVILIMIVLFLVAEIGLIFHNLRP